MTPSRANPASNAARASRLASGAVTRLARMVVAAVPAVELRGAPGILGRSLSERRAAAPVHMHVDEARQYPPPAQVDR